MAAYGINARSALFTGCVLLAVCARAQADVFAEDGESRRRRFVALDPNRALPVFGVLGSGVEYETQLSETTSLRIDYFTYTDQRAVRQELYRYSITGRVQTTSIVLDWRPFNGAFHTSAGFVISKPDINATASTGGSVLVDGSVSQAELAGFLAKPQVQQFLAEHAQDLQNRNIDVNALAAGFDGASGSANVDLAGAVTASASVRWNPVSPYLGIGWGNAAARTKGLVYSVNVGAMYIGRPKVELSIGGPMAEQMRTYYNAELERYVGGERQRLQDELAPYRVLPVVSAGFWYRF